RQTSIQCRNKNCANMIQFLHKADCTRSMTKVARVNKLKRREAWGGGGGGEGRGRDGRGGRERGGWGGGGGGGVGGGGRGRWGGGGGGRGGRKRSGKGEGGGWRVGGGGGGKGGGSLGIANPKGLLFFKQICDWSHPFLGRQKKDVAMFDKY
ncbi:hypothetical protein L9F63_026613, partial [Diploptera punctata]